MNWIIQKGVVLTADTHASYQLEQGGYLPEVGSQFTQREELAMGGLAVADTVDNSPSSPTICDTLRLSGVHPDDLATMQAAEPRLDYLNIDPIDVAQGEPPERLITHVVIPELERELHKLMQREQLDSLGVQGVLASTRQPIDRAVEYVDDLELRTRVDTAPAMLGIGFDRPGTERHITIIGAPEYEHGDHTRLSSRFMGWLLAYPRQVRESLLPAYPDDAMAALPVVAVYDPTKLMPGLKYGAHLLPGIPSWSDAIIKAYILPYPYIPGRQWL